MKQRLALPGEINGDPIDRFTLAHLGWGAAFGAAGAPWWVALLSSVVWDVLLEPPLKDHFPRIFPNATQDTPQRVATDTAAWMLGWGVVTTLRTSPPSPPVAR